MKKILYSVFCVAGLLAATSCDGYLEVSSPSVIDPDFVFSKPVTTRAALDGAYEQWRDCGGNKVFGDGLYYAADIAGSDIERHPEAFANQLGRHYPECFYQDGKYAGEYGLTSYLKENDIYASLYKVVSKANAVTSAMEEGANFESILAGEEPDLGQMYAEAVAMRATAYRELCKNFGDVPYVNQYGIVPQGLTSRDSIYDACIADLIKVEPLMYEVGAIPGVGTNKNYFSRTYVQGLIGRMCLDAAGYLTRRGDIKPVDGEGNALTIEAYPGVSENNGASYGRRSDYKEFYEIAKKYYKALLDNPGIAKFHLTDPRGATDKSGRTLGNPYQYFFEQMHMDDAIYADESIYEFPMQQGNGNDPRPYSFGRPSSGGGSKAYPCKSYGQGRINPAYYYGMFDPNDMRRDVSITMTGSTGKGIEKLIPFKPGSKADAGGLSLNKWDENRQANPWVAKQRKSGINGPYMRMAEIYLGYAEVCAVLGDEVTAKQYLQTVRERSFPAGKANTEAFISKCGSLLKAIIEERGYEYAGEGDRRWTLIRTGYIFDAIKNIKALTTKMMDGLAADGYYEFENGNVISTHLYTKVVDAKSTYGYRLTMQCPEDKKDDPVLYPGWRGQNDNWEAHGFDYGTDNALTNLAIKGLFNKISDEEAEALLADGYIKVNWGADLLSNRDEYEKYLFYDFSGTKAPIYLWPFTPNVMTTGGFTNGYGFKQQ